MNAFKAVKLMAFMAGWLVDWLQNSNDIQRMAQCEQVLHHVRIFLGWCGHGTVGVHQPAWSLTWCFSSPCGVRWFWMALGPIDKKTPEIFGMTFEQLVLRDATVQSIQEGQVTSSSFLAFIAFFTLDRQKKAVKTEKKAQRIPNGETWFEEWIDWRKL